MNLKLKPVIVYDGNCIFCRRQIERIQWWDRHQRFAYLPRQLEGLLEQFPQLAAIEHLDGLRWIDQDEVAVGADAVYQIYRRLFPLSLLAWTYRLPGLNAFYKFCYRAIARNRQRFGKNSNCKDQPYKS